MTPLELASHWTSGAQLPKAFLLIMLGVTYGLIVLLGIGAYRLLKGGQRPPDDPGRSPEPSGRDRQTGRS